MPAGRRGRGRRERRARARCACARSTWTPRKVLGAPDDRDLGVMLVARRGALAVFDHLQIYDARERVAVGVADARAARPSARRSALRGGAARGRSARILLLRLERIGDLLMTLDAIAAVRDAGAARRDRPRRRQLERGRWRAAIPGVDRVLDAGRAVAGARGRRPVVARAASRRPAPSGRRAPTTSRSTSRATSARTC